MRNFRSFSAGMVATWGLALGLFLLSGCCDGDCRHQDDRDRDGGGGGCDGGRCRRGGCDGGGCHYPPDVRPRPRGDTGEVVE